MRREKIFNYILAAFAVLTVILAVAAVWVPGSDIQGKLAATSMIIGFATAIGAIINNA